MPSGDAVLRERILQELSRHADGISLPRLCKRLGIRMSVLLRELAWLGGDAIGGAAGPDFVRIEPRGDLMMAALTELGCRQFESSRADR